MLAVAATFVAHLARVRRDFPMAKLPVLRGRTPLLLLLPQADNVS
jgi:hypothetical protein